MRLSTKTPGAARILRASTPAARRPLLVVEELESRLCPSTLIAVTNRRDLVFDPGRDLLYITTSAGTVQRYSVTTQALLSPLAVGTALDGADLTPDGSSLYAAETPTNGTTGQGIVHQVNLTSGAVTNLTYTPTYLEGGSWDVGVGSAGKALFDTQFNGSGWVPVRQIDLASGTITTRTIAPAGTNNTITQNSVIHHSADRSLLLVTESNISSGPVFTYNAVTDTFSPEYDTNTFLDNAPSAVNRNGTLIALTLGGGITVMDSSFHTVKTLPGLSGGVTFDQVRDILYAVSPTSGQVSAYDTNTWVLKYQLALGETYSSASAFGNGVMTVSSDGSLLFVSTPSGVRVLTLPAPAGTSQLIVSGFPMPTTAGAAGSFTVTAADAQGNPLPGYTGTVHFTSSDAQAVLPADYTFTAADAGTHTFTATLKTAGVQSLTATDTTGGAVAGTQGNLVVGAAAAASFTLSSYPASTTAGVSHTITLTARDAYGNAAGSYRGAVHFTSSDAQAVLPADYTFTAADNGSHAFTVTLKTAGTQAVTATDKATPALTATQTGINVTAAAVSTLRVSGIPSPITAGTYGQVTVSARDAYGNAATGYTGTVRFSSSDTSAQLPSAYTFVAADQGTHVFSVNFHTAGTQALTATDTVTTTITGTQSGITVNPAATQRVAFFNTPGDIVAGTAFNTTLRAVDPFNNVTPGYTGTVHFTSSDAQAVLPADYTFTTADAGQHPFSVTLKTVQTGPANGQWITATDTAASVGSGTVYVFVKAAAAAGYQVTAPAAVAAGSPFAVTVTAVDPYGNLATLYRGTAHFTSTDGQAALPADYPFTASDAGTHTFHGVTLYALGSQSVTATDAANAALTATATPTVNPEPAGLHFSVAPSVGSTVAGAAFSVTVTALGADGNPAAGYTGTVHFTSSDTNHYVALPSDYTYTAADGGTHTFNLVRLDTAGTQTITAADPGITDGSSAGSGAVQVTPSSAVSFIVAGFPSPVAAGTAGTFTVTAMDTYGNVATGYTGTVNFSSSDSKAVLPASYKFQPADAGVQSFSATLETAGTQSLTVRDSANTYYYGSQTGISVKAAASGVVLHVSPYGSTFFAGNTIPVTVSATDSFGNAVTGYTGTVHFTSSDAQAVLAADYTFTTADNGSHTFTSGVVLKTAGTQTVTATDTVTPSTTGSATVTIKANGFLYISADTNPEPLTVPAGQAFSVTITAYDPYGNVFTGFQGTITWSSGDRQATTPSVYTFTQADAGKHVFSNAAIFRTAGWQQMTAYTSTPNVNAQAILSANVTPLAASRLQVTAPTPVTAGAPFSVTVTALDPYGNTATGYTGTVHFTSTDARASLPADYPFTNGDAGMHNFTGVTLLTAGGQLLTAGSVPAGMSASASVAVKAAAASQLRITAPATATAGIGFSITLTALDPYGNTAQGYTDTVHFTSSDPQAVLPADATLINGTRSFNVGFKTAGTQSLTATDTANAALTATQPGIAVASAAAASFAVGGFPSPTTAGAAGTVTVTARDAYGNVATGYTGTVHFTSSDAQAALPADTPLTNGTGSFSVTLKTAGTQSITATDTANGGLTATQGGITVNPAAASTLVVGSFPATTTAGMAGNLTVTAWDAYGNVATGYAGTVHFTSSDAQATLPADAPLTGGTGSFSVTLKTAGTQTLTATDTINGALGGTQAGIVVNPAGAASLGVAGFPSPATAGSAGTVTVTAWDAFGNVATGYAGTVHFASSDSQAVLPADATLTSGSLAFSVTLKTAGTQSVTATDTANGGLSATQAGITVNPAAASKLIVGGFLATTTAGVAGTVSVIALDSYGNVASGYAGTLHFTSSDAQATLPADAPLTGGTGSFRVTLKTAGTQSITATDTATAALTATQAGITVNPAAANTLSVGGFPTTTTAGTVATVTVTANDAYGNVATGYSGTVHFTSSDGQAALPADTMLTGGTASFAVALKTAGTQSVTATDTVNAALTATQAGIAINPAAASTLVVGGFPATTTAGAAGSLTVTARDAYGNVATGYGGTVHFTSSDGQAALPADATLTNGSSAFSLTLKTAGTQALTAADTASAALSGSQAGIAVSPAAAATLSLAGFPSPVTAGVAGSMTVTAWDAFGNIASGYAGTVHFTSSDGQAALPGDYRFGAGDAGTHTFIATLKTAGSESISVQDTASGPLTASQSGIQVNPAAAAGFVVAGFPSPTTAGAAHGFTLTARDAFGNVATGYTGTVHFSSSDAQAALPANAALAGGSGSFTATLKTAGTQVLTATDTRTATLTGSQSGITVIAAAAASLVLAGFPATTSAGAAHALTVTARDAYGNTASGYTGTVHFLSSDGQAALPADYTFTAADAGVHSFNATLKTAGTQALTVRDTVTGTLTASQSGITVTPAAAASFVVAGFPTSTTAGVAHVFTVTARDAYGNVATGYTGTVAFSSSDVQAALPASYTFTAADAGTHSFSATLKTAGTQTLTATDTTNSTVTGSQSIAVTAATATHFRVSAPASVQPGSAFSVTVTALDAYGNVATGYRGQVHFSTTAKKATLPGNYTFTSSDNGSHTFTVKLNSTGTQTIKVADIANSSITGSATVNVSSTAPAGGGVTKNTTLDAASVDAVIAAMPLDG